MTAIREQLLALAQRGLHCDMTPTHDMSSIQSIETFWHDYLRRIDENMRTALTALADQLDGDMGGARNAEGVGTGVRDQPVLFGVFNLDNGQFRRAAYPTIELAQKAASDLSSNYSKYQAAPLFIAYAPVAQDKTAVRAPSPSPSAPAEPEIDLEWLCSELSGKIYNAIREWDGREADPVAPLLLAELRRLRSTR